MNLQSHQVNRPVNSKLEFFKLLVSLTSSFQLILAASSDFAAQSLFLPSNAETFFCFAPNFSPDLLHQTTDFFIFTATRPLAQRLVLFYLCLLKFLNFSLSFRFQKDCSSYLSHHYWSYRVGYFWVSRQSFFS